MTADDRHERREPANPWLWAYDGYDADTQGLRESLCTLGNGVFATRGALAESTADGVHYPGTYLAGVYNRLATELAGRTVENESLVNAPNWLVLRVVADDGTPFDVEHCTVLDHHVELDMRRALLVRRSRLAHPDGRVLDLTERRLVSLRDRHVAALATTLHPEGWSGTVVVHSALDGTVRNAGVARYAELDDDHLVHVGAGGTADPEGISLEVETSASHIRIAEAARTRVLVAGAAVDVARTTVERERYVGQDLTVPLDPDAPVTIEKVVALCTSRDDGIAAPRLAAEQWALEMAGSFDEVAERHIVSWRHAWDRSRITVVGADARTQAVLNLHLLHLLQTVSKNTTELDAGVPARGLHGEAYRGHIFWDELFIFPFLNWRVPELTRSLLRYRARRLDMARHLARGAGRLGAMYPWQSGSDGREETQTMHLNPASGHWLPDASHLQRHVDIAVAYNVWAYWQVTHDLEFMRFWGAEMLLEIARFWASATTYDAVRDRYDICGVMGPDEYHEGYPWRDEPGLDNNAYTNVMAVWCIERAFDALDALPPHRAAELREKLGIDGAELDRWGDISRKMTVCFLDDGVIAQFAGYDQLAELDWADYTERYGNIGRLDRILEAEGDSPNRYKLAKQPDVLMLLYLLGRDDLQAIVARLGYELDEDAIDRTVAYYDRRTSHGSTLSQMIHAWVFAHLDPDHSWALLRHALVADVEDAQGGTTAEGIHLGAMAGTVDLIQRCYTGLAVRGDVLVLDPALPAPIESVAFGIRFRGYTLDLTVTHDETRLVAKPNGHDEAIVVEIAGATHELAPGDTLVVPAV
ncbi:MAG: glycoside hydrolase family 65 protein [Acidimicrobiales bacterium]|nr:glycoside hydrolase family 65 protein [Acidimicrobiales bacterium]